MNRLTWVAAGLALAIAAAVLFWRADSTRGESPGDPGHVPEAGELEMIDGAFPAWVEEAHFVSPSREDSREQELTPEEVIDKPGIGCYLEMGVGPAEDVAIAGIWTPEGSFLGGTRFSVLNASGAVHSGFLPFPSFQVGLGKNRSGEVIFGFGGVRMNPDNPHSFGLPPDGDPMRIYADDQLVYEKDQVWLFDIADDGSSFFYIEPLASDYSSRLVIVSLEHGTETHHDLGTIFAHPENDLRYLAAYTPSLAEVHLKPVSQRNSEGLGTHYFFDVRAGGSGRGLWIPNTGRYDLAHFTSSEEGYRLVEGADESGRLQVVKYQVDWGAEKAVPVLNLAGYVGTRASSVQTSPDGAWLLFHTATASTAGRPARTDDGVLVLLDAATGENKFALFPKDKDSQMSALSNVLPASATKDDLGWLNGAYFVGNDHLVVRRFPTPNDVIDDTRRLYDVYDLQSISLDAQPQYRTEGNWHLRNDCASQGFPGTLGVGEDGRLTYTRLLR